MDETEYRRLHVGIIAGDPGAQIAFENAVRPYAVALVTKRGLSIDDADEIWNDALRLGFERAPTIIPHGKGLRAFVLSVAHAAAVDLIRLRKRRGDVDLESVAPELESMSMRHRTPTSSLPEAVLDSIRRCLDVASAVHRDVISMMANSLTAREIAAVLAISEASAAKLRLRSRAWFARCLEGIQP